MKVCDIIADEINEYLHQTVEIADGIQFSEYKLKKRIMFFKNRHYPTGKVTAEGDYEYWFDGVHPRVMAEVKNLRLDSKFFNVWSKNPIGDFSAVYIANSKLVEFMEDTGRADELSESAEDFSADGNLLLRKTSKGYETWDMLNTFLTNTTARTVNDTAIIERFYLDQSELRKKEHLFKNVQAVIDGGGTKVISKTEQGIGEEKSTPRYELYRRTGEISEKDLFEAQGKKGGDENKFILCRIIVQGVKKGSNTNAQVLFAEELSGKMTDYFKEAHRGPYKGKWMREGMYELMFDHQVRYNDITNQIARGLEWASRILFRHTDVQTLQNVRTALTNGSLIKSSDIQQIQVRMQGFDQLVADRNAVIAEMNFIANSFEIVQGANVPATIPLGGLQLMDTNANKLYEHLRKKLAVPYRHVYREFVLPSFVKHMKGEDVLRLTGDPTFLNGFRKMVATTWFNKNLARIGPHTPEMREQIINLKIEELRSKDPMVENTAEIWKGILPRLYVTIVGENFNIEEQRTIMAMLQYETDAGRRAFLMDYIYSIRGIPVPPVPLPASVPQSQQSASSSSLAPSPNVSVNVEAPSGVSSPAPAMAA